MQILEKEKPDAILPTMGGQTGLNIAKTLAESGVLEKYGVELIGAKLPSIDRAEDRDLFKKVWVLSTAQFHPDARTRSDTTPSPDSCCLHSSVFCL
ncbi:MAG: hypothetical protein HC767_00115 [Akkermansiaceae bacterium]|nr:hypothetical protein [Akkermansiaceae bacterium]